VGVVGGFFFFFFLFGCGGGGRGWGWFFLVGFLGGGGGGGGFFFFGGLFFVGLGGVVFCCLVGNTFSLHFFFSLLRSVSPLRSSSINDKTSSPVNLSFSFDGFFTSFFFFFPFRAAL